MLLKRNDKGEFEEVDIAHVNPELLILSKLEHIEEKLQLIHKADYENRIKADMMTMLTDIKKEIDEIPINSNTSKGFKLGQATAYDKCEFLIHQKINSLKGDSNDKIN